MNTVLDFVLTGMGVVLGIAALLIPYIVIAGKIDPVFFKKRVILLLFLCRLLARNLYYPLYGAGIIVFFFLIFHIKLQKKRGRALLISMYIFLLLQSVQYFFVTVFYTMYDPRNAHIFVSESIHLGVMFFCLWFSLIIFKHVGVDFSLLEHDYFKKNERRTFLIFLILTALRLASLGMIYHGIPFIFSYDTTVALIIFLAFILTVLDLHNKQIEFFHKEEIKQRIKENESLHLIVNKMGMLYDEIRGFRHDFGGITACLEPAIESGNIAEVKKIYGELFSEMHKKLLKSDYTSFRLKHIENMAFRNILATKMVLAEHLHIPFDLQVRGEIGEVDVSMLPLTHILNILLDNAIEGAKEAESPEISVGLLEEEEEVVLVVENTRKREVLDKSELWENGYSTKGKYRGTGLYTLLKLIRKEGNIEIETRIEEESFTQKLIFGKKEFRDDYGDDH